ncbi:MAG: hypothetical protein HQ445_03380, partial [Polaromonas sp.]|nr:hypothetical protein [Polaromonas sp.]
YAQGVLQVGVEQVKRAASDSLSRAKRPAMVPNDKAARITSAWRKLLPMTIGLLSALGLGYAAGAGVAHERFTQVMSLPWGAMQSQAKGPVDVAGVAEPMAVAVAVDSPPVADVVVKPEPALATLGPSLRADSLAQRKRATDDFMAQPSNQGFTVQLISLRVHREAEMLALAQAVQTELDAVATEAGAAQSDVPVLVHDRFYQRQVYQVMYVGHFDSRPAALQFIRSSPTVLSPYKPVVRTLDSIRKEAVP